MPRWYSVTGDQISKNDKQLWCGVFAEIAGEAERLTLLQLSEKLEQAKCSASESDFVRIWNQHSTDRYGITAESLDVDQSYNFIRAFGLSAKQMSPDSMPELIYIKFYWNQTRIGGRNPSELPRIVTLEDAFKSLGLVEKTDSNVEAKLLKWQKKNDVQFPENLNRLLRCSHVSNTVTQSHPCNPEFVYPFDSFSELQRNVTIEQCDEQYEFALTVLVTRGPETYCAVYNEVDDDAKICLYLNGRFHIVAPCVGMFFWDLAQTGLVWDARDGKETVKTDIGLEPKIAG
jgi:hypothetical protein